jgi:hypothetical protein
MMSEMEFMEKIKDICNQRGYLVFGFLKGHMPEIGRVIKTSQLFDQFSIPFTVNLPQQFRIVSRTTTEDWHIQSELLRPSHDAVAAMDDSDFIFYRAYTD